VFVTARLRLAVFLHADGRLPFRGCRTSAAGRIQFSFDDPDRIGDQLELEFDRGAETPASAIFASQKFLRRKMTETLENRNTGVPINEQPA
jgi:hypothetical protein